MGCAGCQYLYFCTSKASKLKALLRWDAQVRLSSFVSFMLCLLVLKYRSLGTEIPDLSKFEQEAEFEASGLTPADLLLGVIEP